MLNAFFPGWQLRCMLDGKEYGGIFREQEDRILLVGNSGAAYETLEAFFTEECGAKGPEDPWEVCEFWKSWAWWKCKEMLAPNINQTHLSSPELPM